MKRARNHKIIYQMSKQNKSGKSRTAEVAQLLLGSSLEMLAHWCLLSGSIRLTKISSASFSFLSQLQTRWQSSFKDKIYSCPFPEVLRQCKCVFFFKISFWKQSKTELPHLMIKLKITTPFLRQPRPNSKWDKVYTK